jgi:hypothetical protein
MGSPPIPPPPPPPGYFDAKAARLAAEAADKSSSSTQLSTYQNPPPAAPMISLTDTISDVSHVIPIVLDLATDNYYHWCHLFDVHLVRCDLRSHVATPSNPRPDDPQWVKDDLAIIQWIYTQVSSKIFNLVYREATTAANLWAALRQLFQDNVDARLTTLHSEFRYTVQGDSPVGVYCQRLKAISDELQELGDPITDVSSSTPYLDVKCILRYVKGTIDHGLHINPSPPASLTAYSDADWAGCPDTRRSTSGYCVYLGNNLISWSSKRQLMVSRLSAEAEY